MKYLVASDIHGSIKYCNEFLRAFEEEGADRIILLGDILYHGPRNSLPGMYDTQKVTERLNAMKDKIYICMRGNCDAEIDEMVLDFPLIPGYRPIVVNDRIIYVTHGHMYNAEAGGSFLPRDFENGGILMHGHTHIPVAEKVSCPRRGIELKLLNPGSTSIPKGGYPGSYAVIGDDMVFTVKDFDGNVIKSIEL